ncbi:hypothetical protein D3C76_1466940 [compost metagenome]
MRAEQHADAVGEHYNHALRLAFHLFTRHAVGIDKTDNKEEVVAHTVEQNAEIQQETPLFTHTERKKRIAHKPRQHADKQHVFHPEAAEQQRDHQHKDDLRHLPERHGGADILNPCISQI